MADLEIRNSKEEEENSYSLRDMLMIALANWVWFAAAIVLCLCVAAFFVYKMPKVYERSAAILIKDGRSSDMTSALFSDITSIKIAPNVDNEIYLLGSKRLMTEVVEDLKLDVWYSTKGLFRADDLYGSSPIEATFVDGDNGLTSSFVVEKKDGTLRLKEFSVVGRDVDENLVLNYTLGDTVSTPVGRLVLTPTLNYGRFANNQAIEVKKTGVEATAMSFMNKLKVELVNDASTVIKLSISDVNTFRAELLLNTLMKAYQEDVIADKRLVSDVSRSFIDDRLKQIEDELADEDNRILEFKESNNVVDFENQNTLKMTEENRLRGERFAIENQIALVNYLKDYLNSQSNLGLIPANVGVTNANLNSQIADYNSDFIRRDDLLRGTTDRNPIIVSMTSDLAAKFESIKIAISSLLEQLNINLQQAETRERLAGGTVASVPGYENEMQAFTRQQTVKAELYLYLLNKKEENDLNSLLIDSDSRIVEEAYGSNVWTGLKPIQIFVLALLLGCFIPVGVLLLLNLFNTTVRSRKDIEGSISVPFLGEIPYAKEAKTAEIAVNSKSRNAVSEAFRILRSNMNFMNEAGNTKVLLITSTCKGSGKTFFSTNMAATLAQTGKKVVLIDGDLRKNTLTNRFGDIHAETGLSNYLAGDSVSVDELITPNIKETGVDMIFTGARPFNPTELLHGSRLDQLIAELRPLYDYIILDSVVAFMVADAVVSARVADHTIYLVREGMLDRRQLSDIEKLYNNNKFPNMMIVLNAVRESTLRYTYGYGYGYGYGGYGYGYGYGSEHELKAKTKSKKLLVGQD